MDEESWPLRQEISTLAARVSLAYDVFIGPRVIGQVRWAKMRRHRFALYESVQADGIELIPEGQMEGDSSSKIMHRLANH